MNHTQSAKVVIGCAGWSVPWEHADHFNPTGSHLERYASRFAAVEINSSFYRPHRTTTYARWAASVPADFRFAVKIPKAITHGLRLVGTDELLDRFKVEVSGLGDRLGPVLVQLPPSLPFGRSVTATFFTALRHRFLGDVVCEPRHASWFDPAVDRLLGELRVARAAADPAVVPVAAAPGGWDGLLYYRLHGSPRTYYSSYPVDYLTELQRALNRRSPSASVWCIFDNTALGAATINGLDLLERFAS